MGLADTQTTNQDRFGPARVLVVDDEPGVLRLVAMALVRWGYEVHTAPGPMQALQAVRELPCFDLLVSDVIMPEMCGPELAKQIRALDRKSTRQNSSHLVISYAVFCLK